jgi:hypothetical protein
MKNDVGYLEHGEMIRLGTILKMKDAHVIHGDIYYKVTSFESYPVINSSATGETGERSFQVNAEAINGYKSPAFDYTKSELQDLKDEGTLSVFN